MENLTEEEEYLDEVLYAIQIRDVEILVGFWRESAYLGELGKEIREVITEAIPDLIQFYQTKTSKNFSRLYRGLRQEDLFIAL